MSLIVRGILAVSGLLAALFVARDFRQLRPRPGGGRVSAGGRGGRRGRCPATQAVMDLPERGARREACPDRFRHSRSGGRRCRSHAPARAYGEGKDRLARRDLRAARLQCRMAGASRGQSARDFGSMNGRGPICACDWRRSPIDTERPWPLMRSRSSCRRAAWWGSSARTASASRRCSRLIAGAARSSTGTVEVLGGDMADARTATLVCPRIAYMPQGLGRNLYPTLSVLENIDFFGRLFGQCRAASAQRASTSCCESTGLDPVPGPAGRQALRRHEAEARAVLRADPRSRPADPRRADHRRRSAVAPAVLGR